MAIKIKCSECKKSKWMNKHAITCSSTCRARKRRRLAKLNNGE